MPAFYTFDMDEPETTGYDRANGPMQSGPWEFWGKGAIVEEDLDSSWAQAPIGSIYHRTKTDVSVWLKVADNKVATDWSNWLLDTGVAANAIPHAGTLTLPQAMEYAAGGQFNVMAYGAYNDNTHATETTAAYMAAFAAACVKGGEVLFPPGDYATSASLPMANYVYTHGKRGSTGAPGSHIKPNSHAFPAFLVEGTAFDWRISDLSIDYGSESTGADTAAIGVKTIAGGDAGESCEFVIERVHVANAYRGFQFSSKNFMYALRDCVVQICYDYGVLVLGGTTVTLTNIYVQTAGGGFNIFGVSGLQMNNCASDGITSTTQQANAFGTCIGQINGFFAEACNLNGTGLSMAYFSDCQMLVQGWSSGASTFNSTSGFTAVIRIADGSPRMVFINCNSNGDTITGGNHYTVVSANGFNWFIGCKWDAPAGATEQYLRLAQTYIWDGPLVDGQFQALAANDGTPDVSAGNLFLTANTSATNITQFDGGMEGQTIKVIVRDADTTFDFTGSNLLGNGGIDWMTAINDWLEATQYDGYWYCAVHKVS